MEATATALLSVIEKAAPMLERISESSAMVKPRPDKWSKKEILGHLIDSASNNHQKFVRAMLADKSADIAGYEQDQWVEVQKYNGQKWSDIIAFWANYNRHLAHLIQNVDPAKLENTLRISGSGSYTLAFMMSDYVEHLKHHLIQIIPDAGLTSNFSMTPYV